MKDINDVIDIVTERTGEPEDVVDKVLRSMFSDIQNFTSKKKGVCIQIPNVGTFYFRVGAIPNYVEKQKVILAHWIGRLFIGQHKVLEKTVTASENNIDACFYNLKQVSLIKKEFIQSHAKYKPKTKTYLEIDNHSDLERVEEYIKLVKAQLFISESDIVPEGSV